MSINSRDSFKTYCLTKLGYPVITINVADSQVEDRIDDALALYMDYHVDAQEKSYYKYIITADDKVNKYIVLPENVVGAVKIFNPSSLTPSSYLFDIRYQIALNDIYNLTSHTLVPYITSMTHLTLLNDILNGEKPVRYEKLSNKLHIDTDWDKFNVGDTLIVECYNVIDPDVYVKIWDDRWLKAYATALIKEQWGNNIGQKFVNMPLQGGQVLNGAGILQDAKQEIMMLREELENKYSTWQQMFIG